MSNTNQNGEAGAKWNLVIDIAKCNGCYNCFIATKDEYVGNSEPGYFAPAPVNGAPWIGVDHVERGQAPVTRVSYLPKTCNHCDDAPCMKAARDGAITKRADGIVIIDPVKAKGQKQIVDACPYGAVFWNEDENLPQAWPFDAHLLDHGWTRTRGAQACATEAMRAIKVSDAEMARMASAEQLGVLKPELKTRPRVWYKNLDRIIGTFVAGTIESEVGGVRDCAAGVRVALVSGAQTLASTATDAFGDFAFDIPKTAQAPLAVRIDSTAGARTIDIDPAACTYLGRIVLEAG